MHRIFLSILCGLLLALALTSSPLAAQEVAPDAAQRECWSGVLPGAALAQQPGPIFCNLSTQARDTAQISSSRWIDTFDHGLKFADFTHTNYRVFEAANDVYDTAHWRHADHWMVDVASSAPDKWDRPTGGTLMRPNQQFWQTDGKIVVEADFAAGHQDYRNLNGWGELIVTTAPEPTEYRTGGFYAYDMFRGSYTLGCRLQADRHVICALMDTSDRGSAGGGRIWEASFFQLQGRENYGGYPTAESDPYWRVCAADNDPDTACRDRFRMELTRDSLTMYVNGYRYFAQEGIPPLPNELFNGSFYVYYASMVGQTNQPVMRFHWDRLAVNPPTGPSAAANFIAPVVESEKQVDEAEVGCVSSAEICVE